MEKTLKEMNKEEISHYIRTIKAYQRELEALEILVPSCKFCTNMHCEICACPADKCMEWQEKMEAISLPINRNIITLQKHIDEAEGLLKVM